MKERESNIEEEQMIRFFVNFILFGLLFYAIWFFFPDTFMVLVGWMGKVFDFIKVVVMKAYERIQGAYSSSGASETPKTLLPFLISKIKMQ